MFRTLLSTVVENAQLAALEITDGVDVASIPDMLDSVRSSAARAAEVLEHLIRNAVRASSERPSGQCGGPGQPVGTGTTMAFVGQLERW